MKNLLDVQKHPSFDPNRDYTLPWQSGMTGIAYNDKLTDPVLSVDDLLENPKLKGKITCLNDMGDALTLVMLANGDDPAKVTDKSFNAAFNRIKKAVDNGQIRAFTGNDYAAAAREGRHLGRDVVVRGHPTARGPATSTGTCRRTAARSGPTTC